MGLRKAVAFLALVWQPVWDNCVCCWRKHEISKCCILLGGGISTDVFQRQHFRHAFSLFSLSPGLIVLEQRGCQCWVRPREASNILPYWYIFENSSSSVTSRPVFYNPGKDLSTWGSSAAVVTYNSMHSSKPCAPSPWTCLRPILLTAELLGSNVMAMPYCVRDTGRDYSATQTQNYLWCP